MCGYCTEIIGISLLAEGAESLASQKRLDSLTTDVYLQVCPDILVGLAQVAGMGDKNRDFSQILAYRGLEVLALEGYSSPRYQILLGNPDYRAAVELASGEEARDHYMAAASRFPVATVEWSLTPDAYVRDGYFSSRFDAWPTSQAEALIASYVSFRLERHGLAQNDMDRRLEESGVYAPEDDLTTVEAVFPALWLALLKLYGTSNLNPTIWNLAATEPVGMPYFVSREMWLQRRAALAWHDHYGWSGFLGERIRVRPELFLYLALLRPPLPDERAALLASLNALTTGDICGANFRLRPWLEEGRLFPEERDLSPDLEPPVDWQPDMFDLPEFLR